MTFLLGTSVRSLIIMLCLLIKRRFISQSLCKFDGCLSQENNYQKSSTFWMLSSSFPNRSGIYIFFLFLEPRDEGKVWQRNLYCFPNSRSVTLKERDTVNSTENLSMKTFGQSEHDTKIWYHDGGIKGMSPGSAALSPSPAAQLSSLRSPIFLPFIPFFAFFPAKPGPRLKLRMRV